MVNIADSNNQILWSVQILILRFQSMVKMQLLSQKINGRVTHFKDYLAIIAGNVLPWLEILSDVKKGHNTTHSYEK